MQIVPMIKIIVVFNTSYRELFVVYSLRNTGRIPLCYPLCRAVR